MSTWKVILATLVIFAAGVFTGALVIKRAERPPVKPALGMVFPGSDLFQQRFLERMKKDLVLTSEQTKRLNVVFRESRERMKALWDIVGPEMQEEIREVSDKIRSELTPEQREKFEALLKSRHRPAGQGSPGDNRSRERRNQGGRPAAERTNGAPSTDRSVVSPSR